ncbi:MAG: AlpA family transcriptional regulator [Burkholderiaceae bacterium]|nr:AlpA family transcriptional regulator [Burkholderiaceae bacterium]
MQAPGRVLIKRQQLLRKVPLADRTIFDMEQRGEFPQRFTITTRLVAWDLQEIDDWIARRQEAAGRPAAPGNPKP